MENSRKFLILFTDDHNKIGNADKFLQRQNAAGYKINLYYAASTYKSDKESIALKAIEQNNQRNLVFDEMSERSCKKIRLYTDCKRGTQGTNNKSLTYGIFYF